MTLWLALVLAWAAALPAAGLAAVQAPAAGQASALDELFAGRTPNRIPDALAAASGDVDLPDLSMPGARAFAGEGLGRLTNTVCRASLIAVGRWLDVTPHLNADRSTIYSEWRLAPETILKGASPGAAGGPVTVYLRGGTMRFGERTVRVANRDFFRGLEPDATFLVFASRIPNSTALVASAGFRIDAGRLTPASARSRYPDLEDASRDEGLALVREVMARVANNPDCAAER